MDPEIREAFWKALAHGQREIACDLFTLMVDPGLISFDVPSVSAAIYVVLSGRVTVISYIGDGAPTTYIAGMGNVFGALLLFDDPLGLKQGHGSGSSANTVKREMEKKVVANVSEGGHVLRLNIVDFIRQVLGIDPAANKANDDERQK